MYEFENLKMCQFEYLKMKAYIQTSIIKLNNRILKMNNCTQTSIFKFSNHQIK